MCIRDRTCTTPAVGQTGTITCTRATLASGSTATFTLVEDVVALNGTVVLSATVTSTAPPVDVNPANNTSSTTATIINQGAPLFDPLVGGITAALLAAAAGVWSRVRRRAAA